MKVHILFFAALLFVFFSCTKQENSDLPQNPNDLYIDKLMSEMSLEEKIGQMAQLNITMLMTDSIQANYDSVTVFELDTNKLIHLIQNYHIGSFLNGRGVSKNTWLPYMYELQRINLKYNKHKIPLLYGVDHVHGSSYLKEGTIFPHNINIACSFDTMHAVNMAHVTVLETSGLGHNWLFAPVLDLGKNKFWGRYYETYGEDSYVASTMGAAYIRKAQNNEAIAPYKVAACAKHFIGYSDPKSGWDRSPAEIPEQILREFFLPPFKAAIDAGVKTIMVNSGELNGIPVHADPIILTKLLREELGFEGVAVTDWMDIIALEKMHFVAENEKEATYLAIMAGIDISMIPVTTNFNQYVKELVLENRISEERINQSVRRILKLKHDLGLFEHALADKDRMDWIGAQKSKEMALEAARESIVLIKNQDSILPIRKARKIVVAGATANSKLALCGGWTYRFAAQSDWWFPEDMPTIYTAIKSKYDSSEVVLASENNLEQVAKDADIIIWAAGEAHAYAETDGSINTLDLSQDQIDLGNRIIKTGKPIILILTEGRPRIIADFKDQCKAIVFAGLPGNEGAQALSEILIGEINPSAKMAFTYPLRQGHVISYNHKRSEYSEIRPVQGELLNFALAEFGHGLSYTDFEYSNLTLSDSITDGKKNIKATIKVTNTGSQAGKEAVLWYISDEFASITRPVKELRYYEKKLLNPGESHFFTFEINPSIDFTFPDANGKVIMEKGKFTLKVGDLNAAMYLK
jgi:beta-glucosidase